MLKRLLAVAILTLGFVSFALAAPPTIDIRPGFGDGLQGGQWQPITVSLVNPVNGEALVGEVQVSLQSPYDERIISTSAKFVGLPAGPGTAQVTVLLPMPEMQQPEILVTVVRGKDGKGETVTRRRFNKIPFTVEKFTVLALASAPDALSYLDGVNLGVAQMSGGVVLGAKGNKQNNRGGYGDDYTAYPVKVVSLTETGDLAERSAGYDTCGLIYIGDISPDRFSETQVTALRGYVASGGILVVGGGRLRSDERFRTWLPPVLASENRQPYGRGYVVTLSKDASTPDFASRPDATDFWKQLVHECVTSPGTSTMLRNTDTWYSSNFSQATLRAPGLSAPPMASVGLFLGAYLFLLVPVNYLVLKRFKKQEWTWVTIPTLVLAFSLGAYRIGASEKGNDLLQNIASVAEMEAGSGQASVTSAVGIFSPRRTTYTIEPLVPNAILWDFAQRNNGSGSEYSVPLIVEGATGGVAARDALISMWSMRVFGVHTTSLTFGKGIDASLRIEGKRVVGTVVNRTGKSLEDVIIYGLGAKQVIGALPPDKPAQVSFVIYPKNEADYHNSPFENVAAPAWSQRTATEKALPLQIRLEKAVQASMAEAVGGITAQRRRADAERRQAVHDKTGGDLTIAAWNKEPLLPVNVNGQKITRGANINLLLVHAPVKR